MRNHLRRLTRDHDDLLHRVLAAVDDACRRKLQAPNLDATERNLLEAAAKNRLWWDASTETAWLDTDSGEIRQVDVSALRPLVIHDAVDYTLPQRARGMVRFRVTRMGERFL